MALDSIVRNKIYNAAIKVIDSRLKTFPDDGTLIRNAPFHSMFLKPFEDKLKDINTTDEHLIAIASWLHGLSTSLGQSFFEATAHALSDGKKMTFKSPALRSGQASTINTICADLKNGTHKPDLNRENDLIFDIDDAEQEVTGSSFSADVYFEKPGEILAVEMKSVRINSGEAGGEKRKILTGKAHLKKLYPSKKITFVIGLPFDPTAPSAFEVDKDRYFSHLVEFDKYFDRDEVLMGPELWDFLSGQKDTMKQIIEIINDAVASYSNS